MRFVFVALIGRWLWGQFSTTGNLQGIVVDATGDHCLPAPRGPCNRKRTTAAAEPMNETAYPRAAHWLSYRSGATSEVTALTGPIRGDLPHSVRQVPFAIKRS
jgi:hypothetical protein